MSISAIIMMIIGMLIIWGGLATSLIHAFKSEKSLRQKKAGTKLS